MAKFFGICSVISVALFGVSVVYGLMGATNHMLWGLVSAIFAASLHCLVFAIFTGSGKDTRLLVEDLSLNQEYVKRTKAFKKDVFPPALYAIFFLLILTTLGGAVSNTSLTWLPWVHGLWAVFTIYYNIKTFLLEFKSIGINSAILRELNENASRVTSQQIPEPTEFTPGIEPQTVGELEWGTHVYAFGKFLGFLSWNTWLVYLYLRFIMGDIRTSVWPFVVMSLLLWVSGFFLRMRYQDYRPRFN